MADARAQLQFAEGYRAAKQACTNDDAIRALLELFVIVVVGHTGVSPRWRGAAPNGTEPPRIHHMDDCMHSNDNESCVTSRRYFEELAAVPGR